MENTLVTVPSQRPAPINEILNSLKRYDVAVIKELEDYLKVQCSENFCDVNANLALLKLYELSSEPLTDEREQVTVNILFLGLLGFYNVDFELYFHLLPVYVHSDLKKINNLVGPDSESIIEFCSAVTRIKKLYTLLTSAKFTKFWSTVKTEEYQDLIYDSYLSSVFESSIRNSILSLIYKSYTNGNSATRSKIDVESLQSSLNLFENDFVKFIENKRAFKIEGDYVLINHDINIITDSNDESAQNYVSSTNTHNSIVSSENIKLEQLSRLIKDALQK